jgi:opacity protein-like surface antigen
MKTRILLIALAAALAGAGSASAQLRGGTVEINGFAGYLFGGGLGHGLSDVDIPYPYNVDIANDLNYGGRIGYNFNSVFEAEFEYARTETAYVRDTDYGDLPDVEFGDLTIQYFMGYLTFNFGHGRLVPYFTIGGGVGDFQSAFPGVLATRSKSRGTAAIGGGVKYFFNPHFGIRADGRAYSSYLGSETVYCGPYYYCTETNWVTNFVANGGIVIAF